MLPSSDALPRVTVPSTTSWLYCEPTSGPSRITLNVEAELSTRSPVAVRIEGAVEPGFTVPAFDEMVLTVPEPPRARPG